MTTDTIEVFLSTCGNHKTNHWATVTTIKEARSICRKFIVWHDLGSRDWNGGAVRLNGVIVGTVSYNGNFVSHQSVDWHYALAEGYEMLETVPDLDPRSAFKQAASHYNIPEGPLLAAFVEWAEFKWTNPF